MVQELDRHQCIPGRPQKFSKGGRDRYFRYPFQVADDAVLMDIYKTLYPFNSIILCWLNLTFFPEIFSTLWQSKMIFFIS